MHEHRILITAILGLLGLTIPGFAQNGPKCSNRIIAGTYGFTCSGIAPSPVVANTTIPIALIGIVKSDGRGTFYGPATASFGGYMTGEYLTTDGGQQSQVDPDCTGTIEYQMYTGDPDAVDSAYLGPLPIRFVIVDGGNGIDGLPTTEGYVVTCHLTRIQSVTD
jgi:hypothetical protein